MRILHILLRTEVLLIICTLGIIYILNNTHDDFKGINHRLDYISEDVSTPYLCAINPNYSWDDVKKVCMRCPRGKYLDGYNAQNGHCYLSYSTLWW